MTTAGTAPGTPQATGLLLLPGMDGTSLLFAPFMEVASARRPVTAIRYPDDGTGTSYEALESYVVKRLPTSRPFLIVAESFSGPLALRIAAKRPPGLRGVVLCASFVRSPRPAVTWLAKRHGAILALRIVAGLPRVFPRIVLVGADAAPDVAKQVELVISRCVRPETLVARAAAIGAVDASEDLARCPVPVLCIRARRDRIIPESQTRRMATLNPAMEIAEIDAPHLVLQARPDECLERIEGFVASLPEAPTPASAVRPPAEARAPSAPPAVPDVALAAARWRLGRLAPDEPYRISDALLASGSAEQSIIDLYVADHSRPERIGPLFDRMCADLGCPVGDRDGAEMRLIRVHLQRITASSGAAADVWPALDEILQMIRSSDARGTYVGERWGIHEIVGLAYGYDDLCERPWEVSFDGVLGDGAVVRWERAIRAAAADWLDAHPPNEDAAR